MEGPRTPRREETASLARLVDAVFMEGQQGRMFQCFPAFFAEENRENHLVFAEGDEMLSHVGMLYRWACLAGCTVRVACVGAVGTHEAYRGRGMATALFQAACEKALADGVDFMMISGNRGLYQRVGAAEVGCDFKGVVDRQTAETFCASGIELTDFTEADIPSCAAAYDSRLAHFIRPREDWENLIQYGIVMCRSVCVQVVRRRGLFRGYFIAIKSDKEGVGRLIEFAGDDLDIARALAPLMASNGFDTMEFRLQTGDVLLKTLLEEAHVPLQPVATLGTLLLLNFGQLMARLSPFFEQRVGSKAAALFSPVECDGRFAFGGGTPEVDRATAARIIFGHPEQQDLPALPKGLLPAPTLWYGMNYV